MTNVMVSCPAIKQPIISVIIAIFHHNLTAIVQLSNYEIQNNS